MATPQLIELIKVLRERTGAGMMDCKKALLENDMDLDRAGDYLREKGIAKAAKKSERIAAEGLAATHVCTCCGKASIVEVNCETDFVARGDAFQALVDETAKRVLNADCKNMEEAKAELAETYTDATVKIGEKLDFRRFDIVTIEEGEFVGSYIHMGGKIGVLVVLKGGNQETADNIAMHIAANNPKYLTPAEIPAEVVEKETNIQIELSKTDPKLANKPENILKNILTGKVNKILFESVLSEQAYLLDDSKKVGQVASEGKFEIKSFVRYHVGEGIEKRVDDFAAEVMAQANK